MDPIDTLMSEHRYIEKALSALEGYARTCGREPDAAFDNRTDLKTLCLFFKTYADKHHHKKEEDILFEKMVECGFSKEFGPLAVMLGEHDSGRSLVGALLEKSELAQWTNETPNIIAENSFEFSSLLRQHIKKEDNVLYPMARQHLADETYLAMKQVFGEIEKKENFEKLLAEIDLLHERYAAGEQEAAEDCSACSEFGCCS